MDDQVQLLVESNEIKEEDIMITSDKLNPNLYLQSNDNDSQVINAYVSNKIDTTSEETEEKKHQQQLEIVILPLCGDTESENKKSDIYDVPVVGSKIYRKYKLREAPKFKVQNLNENKLQQFSQNLQNDEKEIRAQKSKKKIKSQKSKKKKKAQKITKKVTLKIKRRTKPAVKSREYFKNIYKCMCCKMVFENNSELVKHKEEHRNESYACKKCEISFSSELIFLRHIYTHSKPPYTCKECLFKTKDLQSLKSHFNRHSTKKLECGICKNEVYFHNMGKHKLTHSDKRYECGECGVIKETKSSYDYHMIPHTGVKRYQCLYCGRGFANSQQLREHTNRHIRVRYNYECDNFDMKFTKHSNSQNHKATIRKDKQYECDHCGKKLKRREGIEQHLLLHTNHKPYKCPECSQRFHTKKHLKVHTHYKHIELRFKCEICNNSFPFMNHYKKHLQTKKHKNNVFCHEKLAQQKL